MSRLYSDNDDHSYPRHRPDGRHRRDYSPDYYTGGAAPRPYVSGAMPVPPPAPFPPTHARMDHEHHAPYYRPPPHGSGDNDRLAVPVQPPNRPRSTPPAHGALVNHHHHQSHRSRDSDPSPEDRRSHSPLSRTRHALHNTFTHSNSGLGASVLGAIVGGLAAREASSGVSSRRAHHGLSTLVGAAVGGLGANAVERRLESGREKTKAEQDKWERKWGREKEMVTREVRKGLRGKSRDGRSSEESDSDYVYDRRPRRRSEETFRHRP